MANNIKQSVARRPKKNNDKSKVYNTNMASEFYVMSLLFRKNLNPLLTLGNRKEIDILVEKGENFYKIDVKGLIGKSSWIFGDQKKLDELKEKEEEGILKNFIFIFVSFAKIDNINELPEVFIVPATDLINNKKLLDKWNGQKTYGISYKDLNEYGKKYKEAWHYFT